MPSAAHGVAVGRLKQRRDFLRVAKHQRKWVTPGLILQAAPMPRVARDAAQADLRATEAKGLERDAKDNQAVLSDGSDASSTESRSEPTPPVARVGFTVSKKVGNSVARNRARRRLKAAADQLLADGATSGIDYVIIGRQQTLDRPFDDLLRDLQTALKRVLTAPVRSGPPPAGRSSKGRGQGKPAPDKTEPRKQADRDAGGSTPSKQANGA